ncbi:unnamed protein product [Rangifer tarandus platyrhynchus]|uniref:Uncharacterized protein n=2 Tax=Rangifer tarandus platyrhynchus TaxID=3082113 RepID=A0AC60A3I2_RANTA|nr:unnamed protein product [Rangifer tarandus platyrhynchus]
MKIQTNEIKCILEIIALDSRKVKNESVSCSVVSDSVTPWAAVCWAPMSMEFSRQEYWSGLPFPSPGDLPDTGINPEIESESPALQEEGIMIIMEVSLQVLR